MDVRVGLQRKLSTEELILLKCGVGEHSWVPWIARRSKQLILKDISHEYSLEGTDPEADTPILWPPDTKSWLIQKDPDAGKDWRQEEKGTTEDAMVGWDHQLNGHEFEQAPGIGDGWKGLVCCSQRGSKELDMTERLNWCILKVQCSSFHFYIFYLILFQVPLLFSQNDFAFKQFVFLL